MNTRKFSATLVSQYRNCGSRYCARCKEKASHGPYYYLEKGIDKRNFTLYIGRVLPDNLEPYYQRLADKIERAIAMPKCPV